MQALESIRVMVNESGQSLRKVSQDMGRSPNFLHATIYQGSKPTAELLQSVAHVCGYRLELAPDDMDIAPGVIVIDGK